jgi:hypothetical protein
MHFLPVNQLMSLLTVVGWSSDFSAPGGTLIQKSALAPSQRKPLDFVVASHEGLQVWFGDSAGHFHVGRCSMMIQYFAPRSIRTGHAWLRESEEPRPASGMLKQGG